MQMFKPFAAATLCAAFALSLSAGAAHAQAFTNPFGTTTTITDGNTFSDNTSYGTDYENDGTLTVTSNTPGSPGATITEGGYNGYALDNFLCTTNVSGGTISATGGSGTGVSNILGTVNVSGGAISANGNSGIGLANIGTTNVSGGTISANGSGGIGLFNDSQAAISGGTISGQAADVETFGGTVTITGGTFGTAAADSLVVQGGSVIDIYGTAFSIGFGSLTSGTGTFDWTQNGVTQQLSYSIDAAGSGGSQIDFLQATPEPSSWLALGLGALGLGVLTLRARRNGAA